MNIVTENPQEVPYGYCQCGCGQKAPIAPATDRTWGWVKGQPKRFIHNHHQRIRGAPPNPSGLCECGCGGTTSLARQTNTKTGNIRGMPLRFIHGHKARVMWGSPEDRFWAGVDRSGGPDACWPWKGSKDVGGYGHIGVHERVHEFAHRYSYILHYGPIPSGKLVCHTCDYPPCCNPKHLWLGDDASNAADKVAKGRQRKGETHPTAKLTEAQVIEMRLLYSNQWRVADLARRYKVHHVTVLNIVNRQTWRHI